MYTLCILTYHVTRLTILVQFCIFLKALCSFGRVMCFANDFCLLGRSPPRHQGAFPVFRKMSVSAPSHFIILSFPALSLCHNFSFLFT